LRDRDVSRLRSRRGEDARHLAGVNVTLGLPIIRTSVEHGTDFANAGSGRGDPRSLIQALRLAATIASNRLAATDSAIMGRMSAALAGFTALRAYAKSAVVPMRRKLHPGRDLTGALEIGGFKVSDDKRNRVACSILPLPNYLCHPADSVTLRGVFGAVHELAGVS
jgi:hypothetical protein